MLHSDYLQKLRSLPGPENTNHESVACKCAFNIDAGNVHADHGPRFRPFSMLGVLTKDFRNSTSYHGYITRYRPFRQHRLG